MSVHFIKEFETNIKFQLIDGGCKMFKQAFYTYRQLLHPGNLKYIKDRSSILLFVLWFIVPNLTELEQGHISAWYTPSLLLPIALIKMSNLVSKISVPKAIFLVPMSKSDRKHYIKCLLCIKIGVPILFGIGIDFLWRIHMGSPLINLFFTALMYLSYGISEYICLQYTYPTGEMIKHGVRTKEGIISYSSINLINKGIIYLLLLGVPKGVLIGKSIVFMEDTFVRNSLILMIFLDIMILIRQLVSVLEENCTYKCL